MKEQSKINVLPLSHEIVWWVCRALLFLWGAWGLFTGYTSEFIQALFAIAFTHLWDLFQLLGKRTFIARCPYHLQTMLNCYICFACVVGTTVNTRTAFQHIDVPEHIFAGYMACVGAFFLAEIMQGDGKELKISVHAVFSLCFAVTTLVGWEFYEFTMDRLYGFVMQHGQEANGGGLTDTMCDLIFGSSGAVLAMLLESFKRTGLIGKRRKEVRKQYLARKQGIEESET